MTAMIITVNYRLGNKLSIYAAVLIASQFALNWIIVNISHKEVIVSDSLSSLQSINVRKNNYRHMTPNDQYHLNNIKVQFWWCPAHVDLPGNELAERAEKNGLKGSVGENIHLAITEIYSIIRSLKS